MDSGRDTRKRVGCPIRKSTDQRLLAAPHGFSQHATSFIASQCQGIHQMPFSSLDHQGAPNAAPAPPNPSARPPGHTGPHQAADRAGTRMAPPGSPRQGRVFPRHPAPQRHLPRGHSLSSAHTVKDPRGGHRPRRSGTAPPGPPPPGDVAASGPNRLPLVFPWPAPAAPASPASPARLVAAARFVEAIGIEPMTPCLQSRRSPAELRPRRRHHTPPPPGGTT